MQLTGYADDINIMGRTKRAILDYMVNRKRQKKVGLINVDKTKAMVQNRRLGKGGTLTVEDQKMESGDLNI